MRGTYIAAALLLTACGGPPFESGQEPTDTDGGQVIEPMPDSAPTANQDSGSHTGQGPDAKPSDTADSGHDSANADGGSTVGDARLDAVSEVKPWNPCMCAGCPPTAWEVRNSPDGGVRCSCLTPAGILYCPYTPEPTDR